MNAESIMGYYKISLLAFVFTAFSPSLLYSNVEDSLKQLKKEWIAWKKENSAVIKDIRTDVENHDGKTSNQVKALENKITAFQNDNAWYKYLLTGMGIGSLLAAFAFWITADRIVRNRLVKVLEQENEQVARIFQSGSEETAIKNNTLIYCLTPEAKDKEILAKLKLWGFKKIKPAALANSVIDFEQVPDCVFFNDPGDESSVTIDMIKNYKNQYPSAVLFYLGNLRLGGLRESVGSANFKHQVPGNLMNLLKY